jgi:erythromycin esterase
MYIFFAYLLIGCFIVCGSFVGCSPQAPSVQPRAASHPSVRAQPPTISGVVSNDDGTPAVGVLVTITNADTGRQHDVAVTGSDGRFSSAVPPGDYAFAVVSEGGFAWLEKQTVPAANLQIALSDKCHHVNGHVKAPAQSTHVNLTRKSRSIGDTFITLAKADGSFSVCLPEAYYSITLSGRMVSIAFDIPIPTSRTVEITGFPSDDIRRGPPSGLRISSSLPALVADISAANPTLIGLGEATHGTSELVSVRGDLTLELIRNAGVRLILFEIDAIASVALDDYVNGANIDIAKAVAALGFWITDTYEFLQFLERIRDYNMHSNAPVHIWGIDLQNTIQPVGILEANAATLSIGEDEHAALKVATVKRGKEVRNLPLAQQQRLSALLTRAAVPQSRSRNDLVVAVAARSLELQLRYWDGDMLGQYSSRRDVGMATLAGFLISQLGTERACLWAHAAHVSKEPNREMLGLHLVQIPSVRYYAIGFYVYEGSVRAFDAAAKIGVISHALPAAPSYTLEGAIMHATGMPKIAWVLFRNLPAAFLIWMKLPRFVREIGAGYVDAEKAMSLHYVGQAFDAVAVIKTGHDSTPTPTGVRRVEPR